MTLREALAEGQSLLEAAGIEFAAADAGWLMTHVTGHSRPALVLRREDTLAAERERLYFDLINQRAGRVPLQRLLGTAPFLSHEIAVPPGVLIPRPETEGLALSFIARLQKMGLSAPRVLDWGTGSGCLAIAVASAIPGADVSAIDISDRALEVAQANAGRLVGQGRIRFLLGDGFSALPAAAAPFHALISNPPYIPSGEIAGLSPEVRDHDPRLALDGGPDGLSPYRRLAAEGPGYLVPGGLAAMEFGDGQAPALVDLFRSHGWWIESVEKDLSERERVLIVHAPRAGGFPVPP